MTKSSEMIEFGVRLYPDGTFLVVAQHRSGATISIRTDNIEHVYERLEYFLDILKPSLFVYPGDKL
jgi:hypothetical protein